MYENHRLLAGISPLGLDRLPLQMQLHASSVLLDLRPLLMLIQPRRWISPWEGELRLGFGSGFQGQPAKKFPPRPDPLRGVNHVSSPLYILVKLLQNHIIALSAIGLATNCQD